MHNFRTALQRADDRYHTSNRQLNEIRSGVEQLNLFLRQESARLEVADAPSSSNGKKRAAPSIVEPERAFKRLRSHIYDKDKTLYDDEASYLLEDLEAILDFMQDRTDSSDTSSVVRELNRLKRLIVAWPRVAINSKGLPSASDVIAFAF